MTPRPIVALLVLVLASGCARPAEVATVQPTLVSPAAPISEDAAMPAALALVPPTDPSFDVPFTATGCQGAEVDINVAASLLARYLPPGFRSGDPHILLGLPVRSARGAVALTVHNCASATIGGDGPLALAFLAILVEAPDVPGERQAAAEDWYVVAFLSDREEILALARDARAPAEEGSSVFDVVGGGAAARSTAAALDGADEAFTIDAAVGAAKSEAGTLRRYWHSHPRGTSWFDVAITGPLLQGMATCSMRAGTVWADVPQSSICTIEGEWIARVWEAGAWAGRYAYEWAVVPAPTA